MTKTSSLLVGTSSWSNKDWCGSFYPETIAPGQMIAFYAQKYPTVEIDSTWYRLPSQSMVEAWKERTPKGFIFSAKVPKVISHDKYLQDCREDLIQFLQVIQTLGDKLGPLVLQFPYVPKSKDPAEYATGADFIARLHAFLPLLPRDFMWAIEIRNSKWLRPELLDLLRGREVSLAFIDYSTMEPLHKLSHIPEILTAPFVYIRFLGNHREMEAAVKRAQQEGTRRSDWESLIRDRTDEMKLWIPPIKAVAEQKSPIYIYFNNHYAGYAPGSVELFMRLYSEAG